MLRVEDVGLRVERVFFVNVHLVYMLLTTNQIAKTKLHVSRPR